MTHTLHRRGTVESLQKDYVFLCMPSKNINHVGSGPKLRRFLEIALKNKAVCIGDARKGNAVHQGGLDNLLANVEDRAVVQAVFNNKPAVVNMLNDLREADLGLSVVLSGLGDEVRECCSQSGLHLHTVEHSMGIWGKTAKLPPEEILAIATMCGHAMVAVNHIYDVVARIKSGGLTPAAGAQELFQGCMCGIFNTDRAAKLLKELADK